MGVAGQSLPHPTTMSTINNNFLTKSVLYNLKKLYSKVTELHHVTGIRNDVALGTSVAIEEIRNIKAIVLPNSIIRTSLFDAAYLSANRHFTYGALFDENSTAIILDAIPGIVFSTSDFCIIDGCRYDFKKVIKMGDNSTYMVSAKQATNTGE